jgi:hypothetical protein
MTEKNQDFRAKETNLSFLLHELQILRICWYYIALFVRKTY